MGKIKFIERELHKYRDLIQWNEDNVPEHSGVYILMAKDGQMFQYPNGKSTIFYIGQATNLYRRLREHKKYSLEAKQNRKIGLYWPRYEFAAKFGALFTYVLTKQGESPRGLEQKILHKFALMYRSFPIANGVGSWGKIK